MYAKSGKKVFDMIGSMFLFVSLSWLFILIFFLYIFAFELPCFYKSLRIGKSGKYFTMMKFRTLKINQQLPLKERQFWLGRFLRATNLDELPQLWNVLIGEMSLVGPRPMPVAYKPLLSKEQNGRHAVLPGITGLAQVNGKNTLSWEKKFELDLSYVRQISFWLDLKILLKTITLLLQMNKDVSLDEKPFSG